MRSSKLLGVITFAASVLVGARTAAAQGKVVASNDEWFMSTFGPQYGDQQFISNITSFFGLTPNLSGCASTNTCGVESSILIYGIDNPTTISYLNDLGYGVTVNASATSFTGYGAVFAEGNYNIATEAGALTTYVDDGGNVLDIGGTGIGSGAEPGNTSEQEAEYNDAFLDNFGLSFVDSTDYNGIGGYQETSGLASQGPFGAALFTGVDNVWADNGSDLGLTVLPVAGVTSELFTVDEVGEPDPTAVAPYGAFGAAEYQAPVTSTPEPASLTFLATGLVGLAGVARRKLRRSVGS